MGLGASLIGFSFVGNMNGFVTFVTSLMVLKMYLRELFFLVFLAGHRY